jgi:selenocysteine lyase/cysteine desulfurase
MTVTISTTRADVDEVDDDAVGDIRLDRTGPLLPLVGADALVPLVTGEEIRYANLDLAASAPALVAVNDRVQEALAWYSSVHRGAGFHSQVTTAAYESARESVRRFVGGRVDDVVVFTRNTTDSLNLLASAVAVHGPVLALDVEHHANLLPWRRFDVTTIESAATLAETVAALEEELARRHYALLAVTGISNVTGESLPLGHLARVAHRHGARIAVDGAQLVPHRRVDLADRDIDYLAFSGHKLYAPFGAGALIGRRDWLDQAPPHLPGGGAVRQVGLLDTQWRDAPERHEGGTPNSIGVIALAAACETLDRVDGTELQRHEQRLVETLVGRLSRIDGVRIARLWPDSTYPAGIVTFVVDGYPAALVAAVLSAEHGVGVRDGRFCAHPLLRRLGLPDGAVRASVGVGTTSEDVERLGEALEALVLNGPRWTYRVDDGHYVPTDDPRRLPAFLGGGPLAASVDPCLS